MSDRPVSNLLGLAVLGVLAQRPMHRYEIATTIREQGKDDDMAVKWGSLYTVVKNLERHGLVEAAGVDRDGARPERTTYRITDAGRAEMGRTGPVSSSRVPSGSSRDSPPASRCSAPCRRTR